MHEFTLTGLAQISLKVTKTVSKECNIDLVVDGEVWKAYEVSITRQDLLFFTDKGTVTYLVDNYGGEGIPSIFDWEKDS